MALALLLCAVGIWYLLKWYIKLRPYRYLRNQTNQLITAYQAKEVTDLQLQDRTNELFKRLLIHVEGIKGLYPTHGREWQEVLSRRFNETAFLNGAGQSLGEARFIRPQLHNPDLVNLIQRTLGKVRPPKKARND